MYYESLEPWVVHNLAAIWGIPATGGDTVPIIKLQHALEPAFLMGGRVAASVAQQSVIYALGKIQTVHYERLEGLDRQAVKAKQAPGRVMMLQVFYHAYWETWKQVKVQRVCHALTHFPIKHQSSH